MLSSSPEARLIINQSINQYLYWQRIKVHVHVTMLLEYNSVYSAVCRSRKKGLTSCLNRHKTLYKPHLYTQQLVFKTSI